MKRFTKRTWGKTNNKYGAKSTRCESDHYHPSMGEAAYCNKLLLMKKGKAIKEYEYEKRYALEVNGKTIGHHKPDFTVHNTDGSISVHEFKGVMTRDWMLRKKLFEAIYTDIPYRVVGNKDLI